MRAEFISILNHDGQYQNALKRYNDIFTPAVLQSLDSVGGDYQSAKDASYSYIWHRHTEKVRVDAEIAYKNSWITAQAFLPWPYSKL